MNKPDALVLLIAVSASGVSFAGPILSSDIALVGGREWAQPALFLGTTWNEVDKICPEIDDGICTDGELVGLDLLGWVWASDLQVQDMFIAAGVPGPVDSSNSVFEIDSTWAPQFHQLFDPTPDSSGIIDVVWGFSRTSRTDAPQVAIAPRVYNAATGGTDFVNYDNPDAKASSIAARGIWIYREVSAPATLGLMALGLLLLRRRLR